MVDFEAIYQVVSLIPVGRVSSYGAIASYLGSKGGARLVGWTVRPRFLRTAWLIEMEF
ncbi:MAG: hypothetical protein RI950_423 [Bacteroidota bacterium]